MLNIGLEELPSLTNEQWGYLLDKNLDHQLIGTDYPNGFVLH